MNVEERPLNVNYREGRGGKKPDVIVIHIQEGTQAGTDSWFRNPASGVSAHYGVSKTGAVVQWVDDADTAYHAGKVTRPTAAIVKERSGTNPNSYSLGIECEGKAVDEPTRDLFNSLVELVQELAARHSIPLTRRHVIGHREIRADKTCPGLISVDKVVEYALMGAQAKPSEVGEALDEIDRQTDKIRNALEGE